MGLRSIVRRHRPMPELESALAGLQVVNEAAAGQETNCPTTWEPFPAGRETQSLTDPELSPRDEAVALLHATAEVEHALMVQYLYAGYSISDPAASDPLRAEKQKRVDLIRYLLLHIAREEMAHLATVQNLLHLLGAPLHLDREHSAFASELLPFRFKLEPVSPGSLAKYVIAESRRPLPDDGTLSPSDAALIKGEVTDQAKASNDGICPSHVGDIFARLLWLFRPAANNASNAEKARKLSDEDFRLNTQEYQAAWKDWGFDPKGRAFGDQSIKAEESIVRQFSGNNPVQLRKEAVKALEDIAEQGEGTDTDAAPATDGESHFEWFWLIYRTFKELTELPGGAPVHNVPINPNTSSAPERPAPYHKMVDAGLESALESGRITNERSRRWAQLFNLRYRILLTQLHHFLRTDTERYDVSGDRTARGYLLIGVFNEMRRLKKIAGKLVQLPRTEIADDPHRAGPPFELPYTTQIPDGEANRWRSHLDASQAAIRFIAEMQSADATDQNDEFLSDVKAADEADQLVMKELAAGRPLPPQSQEFPKVVRILEEAVRGFSVASHGNFWAELQRGTDPPDPPSGFVNAKVTGPILKRNVDGSFNAANSDLLKRLKGDGVTRMPRERPPIPASRVAYIESWVTRNCPDSAPPYPGLTREREPAAEVSISVPTPPPPASPSFAINIKPLFTPSDVSCMKAVRGFDLSKYDDVKARAAAIFGQLDGGLMPPSGRWPQADIDLFKAWMDTGFRED